VLSHVSRAQRNADELSLSLPLLRVAVRCRPGTPVLRAPNRGPASAVQRAAELGYAL